MTLFPSEGTDLPWVKSKSMQERDHPWHGTRCFSPLGLHGPTNFLLSRLILHCASRISSCRVKSRSAPRYLETEAAICMPLLTNQACILDWNMNYMAWILIWHLMNSFPSATGQETRHFGYMLFHLCIWFIASGPGSAWRGFSASLSPLHMKIRWQENPPPTFRFANLSTLFSHADWALPVSAVQDVS